MGSEETEYLQRSILNCYSSMMTADSISDDVAEMSICSKVDHFYSFDWNAMVLGNETEFAHPHCSVLLQNQTTPSSLDLVHYTSDSGLVGSEIFSEKMVTSNGDMDEFGCHSDFLEDQPNAKRKRNVSSCKNAKVEQRMDRNGNSKSKKTVDSDEDIVHFRAKRGQARSSHSLAERMRRERISERMRLLQDLVPGCHKITGKAVVLDEIINYVQSLQQQVEFLSMKLANVNPEVKVDIEQILSDDNLWNSELQSILHISSLQENGLSEMEQ